MTASEIRDAYNGTSELISEMKLMQQQLKFKASDLESILTSIISNPKCRVYAGTRLIQQTQLRPNIDLKNMLCVK